jgi:2-hydroxychromene-2-carboxylate isomerase
MPTLDFYFDYRSPYSYLAHTQAAGLGAEIAYHPFDILQLMQQVGNVPTSVTCKPKSRYLGADLRRWVELYRVPFQRHPRIAQIDARRLLRATLAAEAQGHAPQAVTALFRAYWGAAEPLETAEQVAAVLAAAGVAVDAGRIDDPALDAALDQATAAAAERGVFGAPAMFIGDEMFFGNDRLEFVRASLARAA